LVIMVVIFLVIFELVVIFLKNICYLKNYDYVCGEFKQQKEMNCEYCKNKMSLILNKDRIENIYKTKEVFSYFRNEIKGLYECKKCKTISAKF